MALGQGDVEALGLLYDRYAAAVYGLALALTATAADAEAVTLAVFLTLRRRLRAGTFGEQTLGAWLRTAVWDTVQARRHGASVQRLRHAPWSSAEWTVPWV